MTRISGTQARQISGKVGLVMKKAMVSTFSPDHPITFSWATLPCFPYPVDKERMAKKLVRKSEHELWAEPRFHDTYELVCFQLSNTGVFRYFTFFKRKDSILKVKEAENEACKGLE